MRRLHTVWSEHYPICIKDIQQEIKCFWSDSWWIWRQRKVVRWQTMWTNSTQSRFIYVGIRFEDEVQALLILSLLSKSWFGTITTISSLVRGVKLTFKGIHYLKLGKDVHGQSVDKASSSLLSTLSTENKWRKSKKRSSGRGRLKSIKRD